MPVLLSVQTAALSTISITTNNH